MSETLQLERAATYYRMSKDEQEHSIERQQGQVVPYVATKGYTFVQEYRDEGIEGWKDGDRRPTFQQMCRDAMKGKFDVIICDDVDRFGRFDIHQYGAIVYPLKEKGIRLETVAQGPIDWNDTLSQLNDAIRMVFKREQSSDTSRRILTRFIKMAEQGMWVSGAVPYGFRKDPETGKLVPGDPAKVKVIQWLFETYATRDVSLRWLVEELYKRGVPSPTGKARWTGNVLHKTLSKRSYVGDFYWNKTSKGQFQEINGGNVIRRKRRGETKNAEADWVFIPDNHAALVSREMWETVQGKLAGNKVKTTPYPGGGDFLLSGLMVCGHCGSNMLGRSHRRWKRGYLCSGYNRWGKQHCNFHWVTEKEMVDVLVRKLQQDFLNPANLDKLRAELRDQAETARKAAPATTKRLQAKLADLKARIAQAMKNMTVLPQDLVPDMAETIRGMKAERDRVSRELADVDTPPAVVNAEAEVAAAEEHLWLLRDALDKADPAETRAVLRELVSRVELWWEHEEHGQHIKCKLARGLIYVRTDEKVSRLVPSASGGEPG